VHKDIRPAELLLDKAKALLRIEPFNCASWHAKSFQV
jgi:hypothetical protein